MLLPECTNEKERLYFFHIGVSLGVSYARQTDLCVVKKGIVLLIKASNITAELTLSNALKRTK